MRLKKNILLVVCMLLFVQVSFGQITLKHSYRNGVEVVYEHYGDISAFKYLEYNLDNEMINIYNSDNSLYKSIKVNLEPRTYISHIFPLYTDVINSDPLIEFYYKVTRINGQDKAPDYEAYIVNENGDLIQKFEKVSIINVLCMNGEFLLQTKWYETEVGCNIYSLGTKLNNIPAMAPESIGLPYPNPADRVINIPYSLKGRQGTVSVFSAGGQFVEQKNVDGSTGRLMLDVSGYPKGMYYYKAGEQRGEFMVD